MEGASSDPERTEPRGDLAWESDLSLRMKPKEYTCPVCTEYLIPPIFQCSNGHLLCKSCRDKVISCPQCRDSFLGRSKIRNLALEGIIEGATVDCKYLSLGCSIKVKYSQIHDHLLDCKYVPRKFCLSLGIHSCIQEISETSIAKHLKDCHDIKIIRRCSGPDMHLYIWQFIPKRTCDSRPSAFGDPFVFRVNGRIFFVKVFIDRKERYVSWMFCFAGDERVAEEYKAHVRFYPDSPGGFKSEKYMDWTSRVHSFDRKFEEACTMCVPFQYFMKGDAATELASAYYKARFRIHMSKLDCVPKTLERGSTPFADDTGNPLRCVLTELPSRPDLSTDEVKQCRTH